MNQNIETTSLGRPEGDHTGATERGGHVTAETVIFNLETQHYVKEARSIIDVLSDDQPRSKQFASLGGETHVTAEHIHQKQDTAPIVLTEREGLESFYASLQDLETRTEALTISSADAEGIVDALLNQKQNDGTTALPGTTEMDRPESGRGDIKEWLRRKIEALKYTSYLGEPELREAAQGVAHYWKSYLDEDPNRQLLVPGIETAKSPGYVLKRILENFSDDEIEQFKGRLVLNASELTAAPEDSKVVLLDDWIMSGDQLFLRLNSAHAALNSAQGRGFGEWVAEEAYLELDLDVEFTNADGAAPSMPANGYTQFDREVEIHTFIADRRRVENGFTYPPGYVGLPVKSYFMAPDALDAHDNRQDSDDPLFDDRYFSRITGLHSSVDNHFSLTLNNVIKILDTLEQAQGKRAATDQATTMPPLTNIIRTYRTPNEPEARVQAEL